MFNVQFVRTRWSPEGDKYVSESGVVGPLSREAAERAAIALLQQCLAYEETSGNCVYKVPSYVQQITIVQLGG